MDYDFPRKYWEWNNHPNWLSLHHFSGWGWLKPTSAVFQRCELAGFDPSPICVANSMDSLVHSSHSRNSWAFIYQEWIFSWNFWDDFSLYPLVNIQKTIENHHAINGKIHYFYGHFQLLCNKLPEGTPPKFWRWGDSPDLDSRQGPNS